MIKLQRVEYILLLWEAESKREKNENSHCNVWQIKYSYSNSIQWSGKQMLFMLKRKKTDKKTAEKYK